MTRPLPEQVENLRSSWQPGPRGRSHWQGRLHCGEKESRQTRRHNAWISLLCDYDKSYHGNKEASYHPRTSVTQGQLTLREEDFTPHDECSLCGANIQYYLSSASGIRLKINVTHTRWENYAHHKIRGGGRKWVVREFLILKTPWFYNSGLSLSET